jgi:hypothetical protein
MTIAAGLANDVAIGPLIVEDNAPSTLLNILGAKLSFKLGFLCWMVILVTDVFAAWGLYIFLKPVSKILSLIAAWFRLVYAAMLAVSIFNLLYIILLIDTTGATSVGISGTLGTNVMFYLDAFDKMFSVSLIVFGIHVLLLGYLVYRSIHFPKILGILLIIGFLGYIIINISKLLFPQYDETIRILEWIFLIPMLSEVALGLWLLIVGFRNQMIVKK